MSIIIDSCFCFYDFLYGISNKFPLSLYHNSNEFIKSSKYDSILLVFLMLPVNMLNSVLRLKIVNEFCPLDMNVVLYFIFTVISMYFSVFVIIFILFLLKKYINLIPNSINVIYCIFLFIWRLFIYAVHYISPVWIFNNFLFVNFRLFFGMIAPYAANLVVINVITKERRQIDAFEFAITENGNHYWKYQN